MLLTVLVLKIVYLLFLGKMAPTNKKEKSYQCVKRKLFTYSPSKVDLALKAIRDGMKVATAGRTYKVPRSTLRNKISGRAPETSGHVGPEAVLGKNIEDMLVTWVKQCSRNGFPINKDGLLDSVKKIVIKGNLKTPFKNNRPGRTWFLSFMARHPDLTKKRAEYINKARALITEDKIRKWFEEVTELLGPEGCEVLKDPSRVWNCDETSFFLAPKGGLILAPRGEHVYDTSKNSDKENITTLFTVNAAGQKAPPLTLYKYKRMNQDVIQNAPDNWSIGKTDKGWMTGESFYEYIGNVFIPHLKKEGVKLPVILFLDGHKSHLTLHLSSLCRENGIIVVALVPNTTHMLQPLDVAVFFPLKQSWLKYVRKWRIDHNGEDITKFNLPAALNDILLHDAHFAENVRAGFKTCGLYPFDPDQVNYKRVIGQPTKNVERVNIQVAESSHLQYLESKISPDMLKDFQETYTCGLDWSGCVEAHHLYQVWLKVKDDCTVFAAHDDSQTNRSSSSPSLINDQPINLHNTSTMKDKVVTLTADETLTTPNIIESPKMAIELAKSCLQWPNKISPTSTRKREYIPSVLTSDKWKEIMSYKEKERQEKEQQKLNKRNNRKKNKIEGIEKAEKKKPKAKIQASESETSEEERFSIQDSDETCMSEEQQDNVDDIQQQDKLDSTPINTDINCEEYKTGDFVIFEYEREYFVGKIESLNEEAMYINAMQKSLKNWKWPNKPDVSLYCMTDIKEKIKTPKKINSKREFYYVPEMEKYWEFVN